MDESLSTLPPAPELVLTVADLPAGNATAFDVEPVAAWRAALAQDLGIDTVRKLRFTGEVAPEGASDWRLTARLGATVVQACVVTLDPVTTRVEEDVERSFLSDVPDTPDSSEVEIPEDVSIDPLGPTINLGAIIAEELALALPPYPRADGVDFDETRVSAPGVAPMTDEDAKPFAGLKALRDRLEDDGE